MITLFNDNNTINRMKVIAEKIRSLAVSDEFEKTRNQYIVDILKDMILNPEDWDRDCQINIEWIGSQFNKRLDRVSSDSTRENLDDLFSICFRYALEFELNNAPDAQTFFAEMNRFATGNLEIFEGRIKGQIQWALTQMPIAMTKRLLNHEDVAVLKKAEATKQEVEDRIKTWNEQLKSSLDTAMDLAGLLQNFKTGANFVALHQGFKRLRDDKRGELFRARVGMIIMGLGALAPLAAKIVLLFNSPASTTPLQSLLAFLPFLSMSVIFLYFYRVSLMDHKSIKSQLLQLDLRMSLCEFIQSYADYAAEIKTKDKEALTRFEQVVFSGIVAEESKIPAAFDGMEQLANVFNSVKKAGSGG
nr:hypothetical protein [uncultured Pseudodesulfovibrio sp.]